LIRPLQNISMLSMLILVSKYFNAIYVDPPASKYFNAIYVDPPASKYFIHF